MYALWCIARQGITWGGFLLHDSIVDCIGCTPMVHLSRLFPTGPQVYAKLELLNPAGSVKDRTARYIIETGLREGFSIPVRMSWRAPRGILASPSP